MAKMDDSFEIEEDLWSSPLMNYKSPFEDYKDLYDDYGASRSSKIPVFTFERRKYFDKFVQMLLSFETLDQRMLFLCSFEVKTEDLLNM